MSVIAHLRLPADSFELGRILDVSGGLSIALENMVPLGDQAVPFFTVYGESGAREFEAAARDHPTVSELKKVSSHDDRTLYALEWDVSRDRFFTAITETGAHLLSATGGPEKWEFELRFNSHEGLSTFRDVCSNVSIDIEVGRVYNPTRPETGPFYGLTQPQRDTLVRAVEGGYYSIPRQLSTKDLAEEFGISDQAVTERLRRAIITLVDNSLVAAMEAQEEYESDS